MSCSGVERWLDEGMPRAGAAVARKHLERCAACARAYSETLALEAALLAGPLEAQAPAGFADRVMARVQAAEALARRLDGVGRRTGYPKSIPRFGRAPGSPWHLSSSGASGPSTCAWNAPSSC